MSWYPPPQDPYAAAAAYGGYAPPPPPGQPAYYGYQAPPPPPQQAYPPQQAHAYGRYDYAAYAGYAQAPPPPQPAPPPPQAPPHHHHHQYYGYPHHQPSHSPAPPPVASPPPPQQPPLREGELRPPPDVGVDPNSFRRFFSQQLDGLTFNSKPIITALTLFAHEHLLRMSGVVAQCLDEHLRSCPPQHVLPTFYLLDSISKNIGPPYLALFGRFLERAFLQAYHGADASTRTKLEELLGTWKTGGADGGELFRAHDEPREGGKVQRGIENALFGARGRGDGIGGRAVKDADMYNAGVQQIPHTATSTERSGVLYDVRRLLALRTEAPPAADPTAEANNQSQILALKKLESLILNTQLTTEQVNQIRAQLKALTPAPAPVPSPSPAPQAPVAAVEPAAASLTPQLLAPTAPAHGPSPSSASAPLADSTPAPASAPAPAPSSLIGGIDLGLLSQLSASGALANLFPPGPSAAAATPAAPAVKLEDALGQAHGHGQGLGQVKVEEDKPQPLGQGPDKDEMARGWEEEILRLNVGLTNAEVAAPRPQAPSLLYLALALPCAQCGLRFFASASGKKKMDQHLDWHFKHKRRVREAAGRTAGRGWFTGEEAWYASDETTGEVAPSAGFSTSGQPSTGGASSSAAAAAGGAATIDRAALRKLKVPVPPASATADGGALGDKPCPVCQDKLKSEWSDDEEEWVWWNAVVVDGTLYHATCHAEATQAQQQRAAAASTTGTGTRALPSRESTPASTAAAAASRKRPAPAEEAGASEQGGLKHEESTGAQQQGEGEPQLKRVKSEPGLGEADE